MRNKIVYPFTSIIGQEEMKEALILNAINHEIGGVLILGEKGTAKSTAVRGLANLLPKIKVVKGCRFKCNPDDISLMCAECREKKKEELEIEYKDMEIVELPIGATEDRVVGTLDIEEAIKNGKKKFEIGILAEANRGILYIDEINLLDDYIVDLLLDSAAMGINTVEREGISFSHPAKFILVATMNPEEGDLRPQLLDRFGLSVEVKGIKNPIDRINIIKNREKFEKDKKGFLNDFSVEEEKLRKKIEITKELFKEISISDENLYKIASLCIELKLDGHRGDLTIMKTSMAKAALEGRKEVNSKDIERVALMAVKHRMKKLPFEKSMDINNEIIGKILERGKAE